MWMLESCEALAYALPKRNTEQPFLAFCGGGLGAGEDGVHAVCTAFLILWPPSNMKPLFHCNWPVPEASSAHMDLLKGDDLCSQWTHQNEICVKPSQTWEAGAEMSSQGPVSSKREKHQPIRTCWKHLMNKCPEGWSHSFFTQRYHHGTEKLQAVVWVCAQISS